MYVCIYIYTYIYIYIYIIEGEMAVSVIHVAPAAMYIHI